MELTPQESGILGYLEDLVRRGDSVDEAAAKVVVITGLPALVEKVVNVRKAIASERQHVAINSALVDPEDLPPPWYTGPAVGDLFWPTLRTSLERDPGWSAAVPSLDVASTDVVGLLSDPHSPNINTRGLVLGHVQSGKTANFTATIAKAADAGYRLFIVLSGVHNALRRQTQLRLDQQLYEPHPTKWLQLTDEHQDFGNPVRALALVAGTDLRLLAVVKKNVSRLTRLRDWLLQAHMHGGLDTCPVLIIDDESDQASPNSAKNADLDRTKINARIVDLLGLPRVAYIGYTATPFANVLVNPADHKDIYPRSFIYALPKPSGYFGSEELFGLDEAAGDDESEIGSVPHDMIRLVPDAEARQHQVVRGKEFAATVTPALADAIRWFLMATAARRARSGVNRHSSMLIHTTMRVDPQLQYLVVIGEHLKALREEWERDRTSEWEAQWHAEQELEPSAMHEREPVRWSQMAALLPDVLSEAKVVADNSRSTARLIYSDDPATVIAVGGNTLSRGLTLEGLVSSFFLRSSGAYDSLLQMGRWFGYRPGYEELPRIWTTFDLASDFRFLAEVENGLRQEVDRYRTEDASPQQLPVRIQLHPKMKVTAALRMQFAVPIAASYSGQRPQTTYFHHRDVDEIRRNQDAAKTMIAGAIARGCAETPEASRIVLRDVPADLILDFIGAYAFHPSSELRSNLLAGYIEGQTEHGALDLWSIVVVTRRPTQVTLDLGLLAEVPAITRSKLKGAPDLDTANIGTLMSRPDRVADILASSAVTAMTNKELLDLRTESGRGLVLLYPIDKDSAPRPGVEHRLDLGAADHLVGVAFSFPRAVTGSEPTDWIQVDPGRLAVSDVAPEELPDEEYVDEEGSRDDVDLGDG